MSPIQSSESAPAQPSYILRGHSAQIHAVHFLRGNTRLLTGDAQGWVVLWSMITKRPAAVWKPHTNAILGLGSWDDDKIITHGRDNKIHVWRLPEADEKDFCRILPIKNEESTAHREPWLLHSLPVNALNFCSFAMVYAQSNSQDLPTNGIFLGTPGVKDGTVNVTSLPEEERIATIPTPPGESTGMIMAIGLAFVSSSHNNRTDGLFILTGYESGHACVWSQESGQRKWNLTYKTKAHSQPVMSLDVAVTNAIFFTSSADAIVARHPLREGTDLKSKTVQTKHAGQQGLKVRNDEKIFATGGWDGRMRVYSVKTMKELAVLKWHHEGCYAVAYANVDPVSESVATVQGARNSTIVRRTKTVAQMREEIARTTHWLAAGSKDGKVSLWHIY